VSPTLLEANRKKLRSVLRGKLALRTGTGNFDRQAGLLPVVGVERKCAFVISVLPERHPDLKTLLADSGPTPGMGILCVGENHQSEFGVTVFVEMAPGSSADYGGLVMSITGHKKSVLLDKCVNYLFAVGIIGLTSSALVAPGGGPLLMTNEIMIRTTPTTPLSPLRKQNVLSEMKFLSIWHLQVADRDFQI
jgi:hypothetical protein